MTDAQSAPPPVKGGLWPYIMVEDALAAAEFYVKAFGAEIVSMVPPGEARPKVNVHLYINGHSVMLNDPMPQHGHSFAPIQGITPHLWVDDVDRWYARAIDAGAASVQAPHDAFWGDRYAALKDPAGVSWGLAGPKTA